MWGTGAVLIDHESYMYMYSYYTGFVQENLGNHLILKYLKDLGIKL